MPSDLSLARTRLDLSQLAIGGWSAQVLFASVELGVFAALSRRGSSTAEDLAEELQTDLDATRRLLGALVAIDLLEHEDGRFANSQVAETHLVPGRPESLAAWVALIGTWNKTFEGLASAVRTGRPVERHKEYVDGPAKYTRDFCLAMHEYALVAGRQVVDSLDLGGRARLLDLGGGPGTYSMLLAERHPSLSCVVFDMLNVVEIATELIADRGLADRVDVIAGDYHRDPLPRDFDVVLISNVLHQEGWSDSVRLLERVRAALAPGGLVIIHAMFINETEDGPFWPALHNMLMRLVSLEGRAYSESQTRSLLQEAGYEHVEVHPGPMLSAGSCVTAVRP
jgi:3-hydroxy-5-methyl-1-naphthoate 3-O-methyltransferase